jgi:hypothetical protein
MSLLWLFWNFRYFIDFRSLKGCNAGVGFTKEAALISCIILLLLYEI